METIEIEGYEVRDFFDITDEGTNIEGIVVTSEDYILNSMCDIIFTDIIEYFKTLSLK